MFHINIKNTTNPIIIRINNTITILIAGEVFSSSMYNMEGFKDSLEKSGYTCELSKK